MLRLSAEQIGVFVGTVLTALGCGASGAVEVHEDAGALELVAKPEQLVIPPPHERGYDDHNVCASDVIAAALVPVNLYFMVDRSGSMQESNKWGQSMAALRAFVQDPATSGLRVALRFFGDNEPVVGCSQQECSVSACAQPLIEVGELNAEFGENDAQEAAIVEVLDHALPRNGFGTPIYPALGGALQWATSYKAEHAQEKVSVVFLTDGEPNGCDANMDHISGLARDAYERSAVRTFAIGLEGSNEGQMHQIARAGKTQQGIFIGESSQAEVELLNALTTIRSQTMSCDFLLPEPEAGNALDTNTVNLVVTAEGGANELYRVDDAEACSADGLGWYFDDAAKPSRIHLCPDTCAASNRGSDSHIDVWVGCVETRRQRRAAR
jgi:hypothetical protein